VINDNREPAGKLLNKVLTLSLDIVESAWRPEGKEDADLPVFAFAERGGEPHVPGPLLRVPQGTEIRLTITNRVDKEFMIGGLRPGTLTPATSFTFEPGPLLAPQTDRWSWSPTPDTIYLAPGATRELTYRLDTPGTYFYWGALKGTVWLKFGALDSQLHGAIVVDPPGGSPPDRIIVLGNWFTFQLVPGTPLSTVLTMNGKAWPHTERLKLQQGDSLRFRVVNTTALWHPLHLHGFYYRVTSRGTWERSDPIAPALQPEVNVDLMRPGVTLDLAFVPTTPGNWVFHCHFSLHIDEFVTLVNAPREGVAAVAAAASGAFVYHSHLNERHQIQSGMYGAIVVYDKPRDPTRDHLVVAGGGGPSAIGEAESPYALVNGYGSRGRPLVLTAGEVHRLRLVSIHPDLRSAPLT
jgi:FtsP/CotA-like multicopper oxidase with cupredoxin domain